jgi:hypothetical protein
MSQRRFRHWPLSRDELLDARGAWQRGWKGDEVLKLPVTENLVRETAALPPEFTGSPVGVPTCRLR